ncbi:hypothetical protein COW36_20875 [bacterium (Candidatus Blackallbacteria) CG17_big_fil_post_rev_8_21_14_2_50_48_46]|uniref:DNA-binding response regulator n=1 Tax=bacterium (Candidatus Blackallbacteria) CG17_big_fil_post_rev_8_21_14_2_50_48_46 TaxID=2014261 RepID=A0A2M7FYS1_9BACT|nr:MAG: hypothetical protein COW64_14185 [bacterium (Candidatus Blackallbacteria) CG18_big_fil_WC_8_21_14_2_50_49_26]PIW14497.1 MAG: hypothetical protein COW36_20875 [bacterium (Candidatus Blackallbacteria) CG17_big_fil_post_rev_8_21_14_2_50_48_46]PIW47183.1 MAG: hypothetical protein COW20_13320 [bacterium (Candidatus Blackallbacteria) CG13_big_fil_rev_8_21_14_2_50_49_14]
MDTPNLRLLILDDEPAVLDLLAAALEGQLIAERRIEITIRASRAMQALELARLTPPDLALVDLEMPEMGGLAFAKALLEQSETPPDVLIYSGHTDRMDVYEALESRIKGYILKGHESGIDQLYQALETVCSGGIWIAPEVSLSMYQKGLSKSFSQPSVLWKIPLTVREKEVLECFRQGLTQSQIAEDLELSFETVKTHLKNLREKSGCKNLQELRLKLSEN